MKVIPKASKPDVTIELTGDEAQHLFSVLNWSGVLSDLNPRITSGSQQVSTELWNLLHNLGFEVIRPK